MMSSRSRKFPSSPIPDPRNSETATDRFVVASSAPGVERLSPQALHCTLKGLSNSCVELPEAWSGGTEAESESRETDRIL